MRMIINGISSISDVITNSSSEVYVMNEDSAHYYDNLEGTNDCISIQKIDWDWLKSWNGKDEYDMLCEVCDIEYDEKYLVECKYGNYYSVPDDEWDILLEKHKDVIEEKLIGKYWVDIEDHFADAMEVSDDARGDSLWHDWRH